MEWAKSLKQRRLELSVMNYVGGVTAVVVAAFAIYRFWTGDFTGGLTNAVIVVLLIITLALGRFPRCEPWALIAFGLVSSVSCILSTMIVGSNGLLWTYLVFWINLLILPRLMAACLNGAIIVLFVLTPDLFSDLLHEVSWAAVAVMFSTFGIVVSSLLRKQRRELAQLATRDPLTDAGNRRLMQHDLQQTASGKGRRRKTATVMVMDLDHFKKLNDEFGHDAGDQVLKQFARDVRDILRTADGFYRMGGEEFVILLRGMNEEEARQALPAVHDRISGSTQGPGGPLELSAGAATLKPGEGWSRWLARADGALYRAKASGRNRLEIAD